MKVILATAVVGSIVLFVQADHGSHSVSDTLIRFVGWAGPLWLIALGAIGLVRIRRNS